MKPTLVPGLSPWILATALVLNLLVPVRAGAAPLDRYWTESGIDIPASTPFHRPRTWETGDWVLTGTSAQGKRDSISKTLVVRHEEEGWVIEIETLDKSGKETVTQVLVTGMDAALAGNPPKVGFLWMKTLNADGRVDKLEGPMMAVFGTLMKSTYEKLVTILPAYVEGGTVSVPAGRFHGTNYVRTKVRMLGMQVETESWFHEAVPVNGLVRTRTTDGKTLTELLSFGTGGTPRIP